MSVMRGVNLIPTPRREAHRLHRRAQLWLAFWVTTAAVAVVLAIFMHSVRFTRQGGDTPEQLARAQVRANEMTIRVASVNHELAQARTRLAAGRVLSDRPDWSTLLVAVSKRLGPENVLSTFKLSRVAAVTPAPSAAPMAGAGAGAGGTAQSSVPSHYVVELGGVGRTQAAVSRFVLGLQEMGLFEEVRFLRSSRAPFMNGEAIAFEVECHISEGVTP